LRSVVDEVAVLFAATDHGKPVTDLRRDDVFVLDARKAPAAITAFRNESELPLRLGIVIDTSESVTSQFALHRRAAIHFLRDVLTSSNDLAFVVGVSHSVLLVQDYTNDQQQLSHGINELAPGGGTALWDAVSFAAQKLANRPENQPTAKLLVVISDGKDNSSKATLKDAIDSAEGSDVFVYTLCTAAAGTERDPLVAENPNEVGPHAMRLLAERTGGAALAPRTFGGLDSTLTSIQEMIRSRYLISYKPAGFTLDGTFHRISISANKSGHKLRVYARKGYYARSSATEYAY
jgi:VWFA-related protein